jgi:dihydroxyacetone kinase DhaKLM complex PTS-EIIA-like component DhaM
MQIRIILSFLFLLAFVHVLPAQFGTPASTDVVVETEKVMSFGKRNGFKLDFPGSSTTLIEKMWKDWAKKNHSANLKKDTKSGELVAHNLKAKMGDNYSVYSKVEKSADGATLMVWFDLGSSFLNSKDNPDLTKDAKNALRQFYYDCRRATVSENVKAEEAKLQEMEKKQKILQETNLTLQKSIEGYKARIKKAEEDLAKNTLAQETNLSDMEAQRKKIEQMKLRQNNVESEGN